MQCYHEKHFFYKTFDAKKIQKWLMLLKVLGEHSEDSVHISHGAGCRHKAHDTVSERRALVAGLQ